MITKNVCLPLNKLYSMTLVTRVWMCIVQSPVQANLIAYIPLQRKTSHGGLHLTIYSCVGYTNILVSKNVKICLTPNAKSKICVTPNANPQSVSVEYRLRWVSWPWGLRWACTFHVVCVNIVCVG